MHLQIVTATTGRLINNVFNNNSIFTAYDCSNTITESLTWPRCVLNQPLFRIIAPISWEVLQFLGTKKDIDILWCHCYIIGKCIPICGT